METLCLTIPNRLDEIGPLARGAAAFLESHKVGPDATFAVDLALEEIVSNVIKYGYKDGESDLICVRLEVGPDQIRLEVEDNGPRFNPLELAEPDLDKPVDQRPIGGLGVFLVRKTVDRMEYERLGDRNILRITVVRRHE
ncbi:MAG: ATP-binding protein [Acidobacteria bacterium]|nr:MAG: ATP-binding protein [Acidobacteriota bacterium]